METLTLDPQISPNKRPKTESQTLTPLVSPSTAKGKAPVSSSDDDDDADQSPADLQPKNCGICFAEEGKSVSGLVDSCGHYFCFLCIIEWSKIESRCPLCRARFSCIRRVRKDGTFIGDGCVHIPVRDQIYDPFGEPVDPYAQAKCTVCNGTTDESLLLLCDLCDSPWHTYCVGLGYTVPEGDWFCQDCVLLRDEQHDSEMNDNEDNLNDNEDNLNDEVDASTISNNADEESSKRTSVSIFDIVRESTERQPEHAVDRLRRLVSPTKKFSCSTIPSGQANTRAGSLQGSGGNLNPVVNVAESSARTLRNCRNVREHINILRDNWDALRTGSLSFSSNLMGPRRKGGQKTGVIGKHTERSCSSHSSTPRSFQSKPQDTSSNSLCRKNPYDVERAWKLMSAAKSMQQVSKRKSASKTASVKAHPIKANSITSNCASFGRKYLTPCASGLQTPIDKLSGRLPQRSGKYQFTGSIPEAANTSSFNSRNSSISRLSLSRKVQTPQQADICHEAVGLPSRGKQGRGMPTFFDEGFACSSSSLRTIAETSDASCTKLHKKGISTRPHERVQSSDKYSNREAKVGPTKSICSAACRPIAGTFDISCTKLCNKEISTNPEKQLGDADNCGASENKVQTAAQADACNDRAGFPLVQNLGGGLSNVLNKSSASSTSPNEPGASALDASCGKLQGEKISACPSKVRAKISGKVSKDGEAKGEIQSLVKLNLKLLSKDKQLGADAFKDIARCSTHTILAACGFEHRKIVHPCPALACNHTDQNQQHRRSTLMPSSCRECFYLFVKNVVNSIMSEKLETSGVAC